MSILHFIYLHLNNVWVCGNMPLFQTSQHSFADWKSFDMCKNDQDFHISKYFQNVFDPVKYKKSLFSKRVKLVGFFYLNGGTLKKGVTLILV